MDSISANDSQPALRLSDEDVTPSMAASNVAFSASGMRSDTMSGSESPMDGHNYNQPPVHSSLFPQSGEQLSDDQVDLVHSLYRHNIPAQSIARVMERMIGGQEVVPLERGLGGSSDLSVTAPPGYAP